MRSEAEKAEVIARTRMGEPQHAIIKATGVPERTVSRWRTEWRELASNQGDWIEEDDVRISLRAGEQLHKYMDALDESGDYLKHGMTLNAIRGTAVDKLIKRQPQQTLNIYQIIQAQQAAAQGLDTIEGTALPPGPDCDGTGHLTGDCGGCPMCDDK